MKTFDFIFDAMLHGFAYIDVDGTLLKKFRLPTGAECLVGDTGLLPNGQSALEWWKENLAPTPIIWSRLVLCYVLRALDVGLVLWTNRCPCHEAVTRQALGRHASLFMRMEFHDGLKDRCNYLNGPVMDDDPKYLLVGKGHGLLVRSL